MKEMFRVWCEYTFEGVKHTDMASPANWFLLTQTGRLFSHGPMRPLNTSVEREYDKLVVMFSTGMNDMKRTKEYPEGQRIFDGDIIRFWWRQEEKWGPPTPVEMKAYCPSGDDRIMGWWADDSPVTENCDVIGNIYQHPELLKRER